MTTPPTSPSTTTPARRCGVLLHPSCLPSHWGIGDLGPAAYDFIDLLHATHQQLWQVLPLGPTLGGSPYTALSTFAGNPLLISLDLLAREGLLEAQGTEFAPPPSAATERSAPVDFPQVAELKTPYLKMAFVKSKSMSSHRAALTEFCEQQAGWLDDYTLFMALVDQSGKSWNHWPQSLKSRQPDALQQARVELDEELAYHQFTQYLFFQQWSALRAYAHQRNIRIVGDIPFYVGQDSPDVWAHAQNFALDRNSGEPLLVSGVPPDGFSPTGQLWNNPIYDWTQLQQTEFEWWVERVKHLLHQVDVVRIDHFRGFAAYWQVPAGATTAVDGMWVEAPGHELFTTLQNRLGRLPIWAEDLGYITPDVIALREQFGFPGMKVLQFAFDDQGLDNRYLPMHYDQNCVCYTATHDNDTTRGWWDHLDAHWKQQISDFLGTANDEEIPWALIRLAIESVASDVVIPWQDVLGLGSEARFNVPGTAEGNWKWRFDAQQATGDLLERFAQMTETSGRALR